MSVAHAAATTQCPRLAGTAGSITTPSPPHEGQDSRRSPVYS